MSPTKASQSPSDARFQSGNPSRSGGSGPRFHDPVHAWRSILSQCSVACSAAYAAERLTHSPESPGETLSLSRRSVRAGVLLRPPERVSWLRGVRLAPCRHCGNPVAADSGRGATLPGRTVPPSRVLDPPGCSRPHAAGARHPAFAVADPACLNRARERLREIATAPRVGRSSGEPERPFPRCADGTCMRPCDAAVRCGSRRHHTTMEGTTHR